MELKEILINEDNWRGLVLTPLCLGSKVWDDDSLENEHFPKVLPGISLKEVSRLEKTFLGLLDFDIVIRGKEYAQALFILQSLADQQALT